LRVVGIVVGRVVVVRDWRRGAAAASGVLIVRRWGRGATMLMTTGCSAVVVVVVCFSSLVVRGWG